MRRKKVAVKGQPFSVRNVKMWAFLSGVLLLALNDLNIQAREMKTSILSAGLLL